MTPRPFPKPPTKATLEGLRFALALWCLCLTRQHPGVWLLRSELGPMWHVIYRRSERAALRAALRVAPEICGSV